MSSLAWSSGSTSAWRRIRSQVLQRDGWVCQLCHAPIDRALRPPNPWSATVHHTVGRARSGDDPMYLVAAHRQCNADAGDPSSASPRMVSRTQW